jgi:hypothetical protein
VVINAAKSAGAITPETGTGYFHYQYYHLQPQGHTFQNFPALNKT